MENNVFWKREKAMEPRRKPPKSRKQIMRDYRQRKKALMERARRHDREQEDFHRESAHEPTVTFEWPEHRHCLATRMAHFFHKGDQVDTNLTFKGESVKVHRLIMSIFLPKLKNLLESKSSTVDDPLLQLNFDNVAESINDVRALIEFVYTGQATIASNCIERLSRLAKDLCFDGLSSVIARHRYHSNCHMEPVDICNAVQVKEKPDSSEYDSMLNKEEPDSSGYDAGLIKNSYASESLSSVDWDEMDLTLAHERYINLITACDAKNGPKRESTKTSPTTLEIITSTEYSTLFENTLCKVEVDNSKLPIVRPTDNVKRRPENNEVIVEDNSRVDQFDDKPMSMSTSTTPCLLCGAEFDNKLDLQLHYSSCHPESKISMFEGKRCTFFTLDETSRRIPRTHVCRKTIAASSTAVKQPSSKPSNESKCNNLAKRFPGFKCNRCGRYFTRYESVNRHIRGVHENHRPCACSICPKKFRCKSHLRRHFELVHEPPDGQLHLCSVCGRNFMTRPRLLDHIRQLHKIRDPDVVDDAIGNSMDSIEEAPRRAVKTRPVNQVRSRVQ